MKWKKEQDESHKAGPQLVWAALQTPAKRCDYFSSKHNTSIILGGQEILQSNKEFLSKAFKNRQKKVAFACPLSSHWGCKMCFTRNLDFHQFCNYIKLIFFYHLKYVFRQVVNSTW